MNEREGQSQKQEMVSVSVSVAVAPSSTEERKAVGKPTTSRRVIENGLC